MNTFSDEGDEIVSFPVPRRYLSVVIHALSRAMGSTGASTRDTDYSARAEMPIAARVDWSNLANARKLRNSLNIPIAVVLLDLAARAAVRAPGSSVTFEEAHEQAGGGDIRGNRTRLGALTKIVKREFGVTKDNVTWPVSNQYGSNGEASYSMTPEVAKAWLESAS